MDKGWVELGEVIRRHRKAKGFSQERLAELAGTHWTYISEIENARRNPSILLLRRIAGGLEVSLAVLVKEAEISEQ